MLIQFYHVLGFWQGPAMTNSETSQKLVEIDVDRRLRKLLGRKQPVPKGAEIYHDLQIAGDDASELLEGIADAHNVSFQGFRFGDYFPNETSAACLYLASCFGVRDHRRKSFTVSHLIAVAERKAWFDPVAKAERA